MLQLAERCQLTERLATMSPRQCCAQYWSDKPKAYQQMHFGERNTATLLATAPDLHKRIRELTRAYEGKGVASRQAAFPAMQFITKESTRVWLGRKTEYPTVYHACIPGKDWLKTHEHDEYPEPTLELSVDGGPTLNVNGNYKAGMIKDFMGQFCKPGEGQMRYHKDGTITLKAGIDGPKFYDYGFKGHTEAQP